MGAEFCISKSNVPSLKSNKTGNGQACPHKAMSKVLMWTCLNRYPAVLLWWCCLMLSRCPAMPLDSAVDHRWTPPSLIQLSVSPVRIYNVHISLLVATALRRTRYLLLKDPIIGVLVIGAWKSVCFEVRLWAHFRGDGYIGERERERERESRKANGEL